MEISSCPYLYNANLPTNQDYVGWTIGDWSLYYHRNVTENYSKEFLLLKCYDFESAYCSTMTKGSNDHLAFYKMRRNQGNLKEESAVAAILSSHMDGE